MVARRRYKRQLGAIIEGVAKAGSIVSGAREAYNDISKLLPKGRQGRKAKAVLRKIGKNIGKKLAGKARAGITAASKGATRAIKIAMPTGTGGSVSKFTKMGLHPGKVPMGQNLVRWERSSGKLVPPGNGYPAVATCVYGWTNSAVANVLALGQSVIDSASQQIYLYSFTNTCTFQNMEPTNTEMVLYDVECIKDADATYNDPVLAWRDGIKNLITGGDNNSYLVTDSHPHDSVLFREWFRVKKVHRVIMGAGRSHVHTHIYNPNKNWNPLIHGDSENFFKYATSFVMATARGQVVMDNTSSTQISFASPKVCYVSETCYRGRLNDQLITKYIAIDNAVYPSTLAETINPTTGAIVTDVIANDAGI